MACHLRLASENAKFGQPEVKLGIGPGYGGTVRLPRLVGKGRALELLLTGQMIDAQEAWRIGLVNKVFPADQLLAEAEKLVRSILDNGPLAVRLVLEAVDAGLEMTAEDAHLLEANHFGLLASTEDMREGWPRFWRSVRPVSEEMSPKKGLQPCNSLCLPTKFLSYEEGSSRAAGVGCRPCDIGA